MTQTEDRPRTRGTGRGTGQGGNSTRDDGPTDEAPARPRPRSALRSWVVPALVVALIPAAFFGVLFWQDQFGYVSTDNAQIAGSLVHLGPATAGQVRTVAADVGDMVHRDQVVATVLGPSGQAVSLRPPFDGVVVARYASPGDAIAAGRPVLSVLDPERLWVEVRIEEAVAGRVHAGQTAQVTVDALGKTVDGRVTSVGSASVASVAAQAAGQNPTVGRSRPLVPVRVEIPIERLGLVYGGQAFVRIRVRD